MSPHFFPASVSAKEPHIPTDKQIAANRRNARKSTGPRTEAGKNKTRLNAVTHGLTGHLEFTTDPARDAYIAGIVDTLKHQLARSIADGYWRINPIHPRAQQNLTTNPFTLDQLETFQNTRPAHPTQPPAAS